MRGKAESAREVRLVGNLEPSCFRPQGMGKGPRCGSLTKRPGEVLVWRLKSGKQEESVGGSSQSRWSPPLVPGDIHTF